MGRRPICGESKQVGDNPVAGGRLDDERQMALLEQSAASLQTHDVESSPTSAKATEREAAGRSLRVGMGQVGMAVPRDAVPAVSAVGRSTRGAALSAAQRAVSLIDSRMVSLLEGAVTQEQRRRASIELGLLARLRRMLREQASALPADVLLSESLAEFVDQAQTVVADLRVGGVAAVQQMLAYGRELAVEVAALGGRPTAAKEKLRAARASLTTAGEEFVEEALSDIGQIVTELEAELDQLCPRTSLSVLDELLSSALVLS